MPETLDISEARKKFNTLDKDLKERPVIFIRRHGKDVFAVVDTEYLETVMETMEILADPKAMADLQQSLDDIEQGRVIDQEDVERELLDETPNPNSMDAYGKSRIRKPAQENPTNHT